MKQASRLATAAVALAAFATAQSVILPPGVANGLEGSSSTGTLWSATSTGVRQQMIYARSSLPQGRLTITRVRWRHNGGTAVTTGGTWTGVARMLQGELGLIWIDAHMDSHTPGTSHTDRLHGMPLAWLLGQADDTLYGLSSAMVDPEHVALIGVRSYEPEEKARLDRLGVRVFYIEEVRTRGLDAVSEEALGIATGGTSGFGVSTSRCARCARSRMGSVGITGPRTGRRRARPGNCPRCRRWRSCP